jgi:hypothetical protein
VCASASCSSYTGSTQTGCAPLSTSPEITDLWTLRATATFSPGWVHASTAICTLNVEPLVENSAWSAPKASAARSCAYESTW